MLKISDNAIHYTVRQLFQIAGITVKTESVNIIRHFENTEVNVELLESSNIVFRLISEIETGQLFKGELSLKRIPSYDLKLDVPVIMDGNNNEFASINKSKLIINADIITLSFIMLSRYEEGLIKERDRYNRFEYRNSLACKYDFIDIPIVDEYAMLLRMWLLEFIPDLKIIKRKGKVIPTHDIDFILRFGNLFKNIKTIIGGDIIARKSLSIAYRSIEQCITTSKVPKNDPLILAINKLIEISDEAGLCSVFFFKGQRKGQKDCTYDVFIPEVKYCMDFIKEAGMKVGMHAGYDSYINGLIFKREKEDIETVYGSNINSVRQHFLRFDIDNTIQIWQDSGIQNDSTLGYAEREGFRCGTCHEYYLYDLKNDTESTVKENPLIVMEGTLFQYRGQNIENSLDKISKLYQRCQSVEGDFVILWHNHSIFRDFREKFQKVYCKFIKQVSE
jgi:hypothetical protein